ncbi:MAG: Gfo/Idh/MocA family oxidoreductase [Acidobacteria bacterium]|nr:Gfo/Idh/MocA family oxidoreductase [Acidobacteriota bacterium]MCW5967326.1 Gfo/Idh/MocA family oxidoreductase [Blastocatellales bacterium]
MSKRLGIGFIGSGFITRFHIKSFLAVRGADIRGVWSPNKKNAEEAAGLADSLRIGEARAFDSIEEMVAAPEIDAIWICGPNHKRIENMEAIVRTIKSGKGGIIGIACEKPLARNVAEAKRVVELVEEAGVLHGYLEDQLFEPSVVRGREILWARGASIAGRPYLARSAEEHSGPHMPWFWQGELQGGGVLNDMMCHSIEVARLLLTKPGAARSSIRPVKISASIASLKWSRPEYAKLLSEMMGPEVDYLNRPSEDFARATITYVDEAGLPIISELTTSWSYVGAGLRLSTEVLGPEYSMQVNTLDSGLKLFFSRRVQGEAGEDLVEKQNAEQGLMPVVANETADYGYEWENRHFVNCFLDGVQPEDNFHTGLEVTQLLMAAYRSAEEERTIAFEPDKLDDFVPAVARGVWKP